jgi:hypothetical protein
MNSSTDEHAELVGLGMEVRPLQRLDPAAAAEAGIRTPPP